jgi:hypothetical protein
VIDYKAELAGLLDGVDLELSSEEEIQAEVAELARDRVNEAPAHVKRKAVAAVGAPVDAEGELTGAFEAVVSDYEVDRQGERFSRAGLAPAVEQLRRDGKATPVLYGHAHSDLAAVVGYVPPDGWELTDKELIARGSLDMSDPIAQKLHKFIRRGALPGASASGVGQADVKATRGLSARPRFLSSASSPLLPTSALGRSRSRPTRRT